jgi:hypothetical protein
MMVVEALMVDQMDIIEVEEIEEVEVERRNLTEAMSSVTTAKSMGILLISDMQTRGILVKMMQNLQNKMMMKFH